LQTSFRSPHNPMIHPQMLTSYPLDEGFKLAVPTAASRPNELASASLSGGRVSYPRPLLADL
jgi:hypothetical protein